MPETPLNPFRDVPKGLNPKEDPFFQDFVPGYQPQEAAQPEQEQPPVPTNTEQGITASKEEVEAYDNLPVKCAGIEITRKQERQIKQIITNLNNDREKKGLEPVELGREITLHKIEIGGKTREELERGMRQKEIKIGDRAQSILKRKDFTVQEQKEENILIQFTVGDLGFPQGATTEEVFSKAIEFGMETCPPETGFRWSVQYQQGQPMGEWLRMGMEKITDTDGISFIICLTNDSHGLWIRESLADQSDFCSSRGVFVFRLPEHSQ